MLWGFGEKRSHRPVGGQEDQSGLFPELGRSGFRQPLLLLERDVPGLFPECAALLPRAGPQELGRSERRDTLSPPLSRRRRSRAAACPAVPPRPVPIQDIDKA